MATPKKILFDDNCPLCCWYTGQFVRFDLLPPDGRVAFSALSPEQLAHRIDLERSRDEIPLLDTAGGPTLYGIDSLVFLLGQRLPLIRALAGWPPIRWFLLHLYRFISYNRRVIVASPPPTTGWDCAPRFSLSYRWLYIVFAGGLGTFMLWLVSTHQLAVWGHVVAVMPLFILIILSFRLSLHRATTLLGVMATPILVAGLCLLPTMWLPGLFPLAAGPTLLLVGKMAFARYKVWPRLC